MRRLLAGLVALSAVGMGAAAAQPRPTARLVYFRGVDAAGCPDEEALRDTVSARLGYDPFAPTSENVVVATLARDGKGLRAEVVLQNSAGKVTGSRQLASRQNDCRELASAVALAISIAVDPMQLVRPAAPPPPQAARPAPVCLPTPVCPTCAPAICPPPPPPPIVPPPPARVHPRRQSVEYRLSAGMIVALFSEPGDVVVGATVQAGARWQYFSLALEGRFDGVGSTAIANTNVGRVEGQIYGASLVPCGHFYALSICGVALAGYLRGSSSGIVEPTQKTTPYGAVGGRLALDLPLYRAIALQIHGDLLGTITPTQLVVDGNAVWSSPRATGTVGLSLAALF